MHAYVVTISITLLFYYLRKREPGTRRNCRVLAAVGLDSPGFDDLYLPRRCSWGSCIELEGVAGVPVDEGNLTRIPIPAGGKPHFAPIDSDGDTASHGSHFVAIFAHERSGAAVFTKVVGWYVK